MFTRVMVPLDGSALAEQALSEAESLAHLQGAPLRLIRVVDPHEIDHFGLDEFTGRAKLDERVEAACQDAAKYLQQAAREIEERGLTVTTEVRQGNPAREIVAATQPGDLLVISTHGRDGARRWFLGSVAEAVTRHAAVPVLLVRIKETAASNGGHRYADLLRQDAYRPEELAEVLNMDAAVVRQEALTGRLRAKIVEHHVLSITRADALSWLAERG